MYNYLKELNKSDLLLIDTFYQKYVIPKFIFAPLPLWEEELILCQHQVVESTWPLPYHDGSSTFPSLSTFENG